MTLSLLLRFSLWADEQKHNSSGLKDTSQSAKTISLLLLIFQENDDERFALLISSLSSSCCAACAVCAATQHSQPAEATTAGRFVCNHFELPLGWLAAHLLLAMINASNVFVCFRNIGVPAAAAGQVRARAFGQSAH